LITGEQGEISLQCAYVSHVGDETLSYVYLPMHKAHAIEGILRSDKCKIFQYDNGHHSGPLTPIFEPIRQRLLLLPRTGFCTSAAFLHAMLQ
jgi:hypothetical protein